MCASLVVNWALPFVVCPQVCVFIGGAHSIAKCVFPFFMCPYACMYLQSCVCVCVCVSTFSFKMSVFVLLYV